MVVRKLLLYHPLSSLWPAARPKCSIGFYLAALRKNVCAIPSAELENILRPKWFAHCHPVLDRLACLVALAMWTAFGANFASENNLPSKDSSALARMYLGEAFVAIGICVMLWMMLGREVLSFRDQSIIVCTRFLGIRRCQTLDFSDVQDFRVGLSLDPRRQGKWHPDFVHACIVFEYRGRARIVANELRQSEANDIVEAIRQYYPQLVFRNTSEA